MSNPDDDREFTGAHPASRVEELMFCSVLHTERNNKAYVFHTAEDGTHSLVRHRYQPTTTSWLDRRNIAPAVSHLVYGTRSAKTWKELIRLVTGLQ
jgi:hypothetical protein